MKTHSEWWHTLGGGTLWVFFPALGGCKLFRFPSRRTEMVNGAHYSDVVCLLQSQKAVVKFSVYEINFKRSF